VSGFFPPPGVPPPPSAGRLTPLEH
jgi:hypothetical protein